MAATRRERTGNASGLAQRIFYDGEQQARKTIKSTYLHDGGWFKNQLLPIPTKSCCFADALNVVAGAHAAEIIRVLRRQLFDVSSSFSNARVNVEKHVK